MSLELELNDRFGTDFQGGYWLEIIDPPEPGHFRVFQQVFLPDYQYLETRGNVVVRYFIDDYDDLLNIDYEEEIPCHRAMFGMQLVRDSLLKLHDPFFPVIPGHEVYSQDFRRGSAAAKVEEEKDLFGILASFDRLK